MAHCINSSANHTGQTPESGIIAACRTVGLKIRTSLASSIDQIVVADASQAVHRGAINCTNSTAVQRESGCDVGRGRTRIAKQIARTKVKS